MVVVKRQEKINISKLKNEEMLLVNTNKIYEVVAGILRNLQGSQERMKVLRIQKKALGRLRDNQDVYVPMTVEEIKECFGVKAEQMPRNTFRTIAPRNLEKYEVIVEKSGNTVKLEKKKCIKNSDE